MDRSVESQVPERKTLDYERLEIGEPLPSYECLLTREMLEQYGQGVQDPDARFPTIAVKADIGRLPQEIRGRGLRQRPLRLRLLQPARRRQEDPRDGLDRRHVRPPREPCIVTEAVSVDEDGRLIDRVITHELKRPREVGKKWGR